MCVLFREVPQYYSINFDVFENTYLHCTSNGMIYIYIYIYRQNVPSDQSELAQGHRQRLMLVYILPIYTCIYTT